MTLDAILPQLLRPSVPLLACFARAEIEAALAAAGWPISPRLSRWIDLLVILEEAGR